MKFELTVLGCGSATPTLRRNPSAQVLNVQERYFLIDCGEGTQVQLRRYRVKFQRIDHVFISHMHGDHYLGLVGFISTLHLLGRTKVLHVYGPPSLEQVIQLQLEVSQTWLRFPLEFHPLKYDQSYRIFEDQVMTIDTVPLSHRIECAGFVFREKLKPRNMKKERIKELNIPMEKIPAIKQGGDFIQEDGTVIPNEELTRPRPHSGSYAYCSDTAYHEPVLPIIEGVDLLYHESTFLEELADRAKETFHSTAKQAATIAQKAGVKQLLLGHFSARYKELDAFEEEARAVFPEASVAEEGQRYRIL